MFTDKPLNFQLTTNYAQGYMDYIEHPGGYGQPSSRWFNVQELGRGAFGVVYKQADNISGRLRAVKTIAKARMPRGFDYRQEIAVMATLAKVGYNSIRTDDVF